jgi:hypothetical protein
LRKRGWRKTQEERRIFDGQKNLLLKMNVMDTHGLVCATRVEAGAKKSGKSEGMLVDCCRALGMLLRWFILASY